jgi:hypothetical protein
VVAELENEVAREILDRRDRIERFLQTVRDEPLEGCLLKLDQVGQVENVVDLRKRIAATLRAGIRIALDDERFRLRCENRARGCGRRSERSSLFAAAGFAGDDFGSVDFAIKFLILSIRSAGQRETHPKRSPGIGR